MKAFENILYLLKNVQLKSNKQVFPKSGKESIDICLPSKKLSEREGLKSSTYTLKIYLDTAMRYLYLVTSHLSPFESLRLWQSTDLEKETQYLCSADIVYSRCRNICSSRVITEKLRSLFSLSLSDSICCCGWSLPAVVLRTRLLNRCFDFYVFLFLLLLKIFFLSTEFPSNQQRLQRLRSQTFIHSWAPPDDQQRPRWLWEQYYWARSVQQSGRTLRSEQQQRGQNADQQDGQPQHQHHPQVSSG